MSGPRWWIACLGAVAALAVWAGPAAAQFEEPDTIPRLAVGAFVELDFRGSRGTDKDTGADVSFGGAPAVGARVEYRLTGTLTAGALGSFTRLEERLETAIGRISRPDKYTVWQFAGELLLRVKAGIPGYFVVGGGARQIIPSGDDPQAQSHNTDSFTEPLAILGAGLEIGSTRRRAFRFDTRLHFVSPADQFEMEIESLEVDWSLGLTFLLRI